MGAGAIVLLALTFLARWEPGRSGWHTLVHSRWLILLAALAGLSLVLAQAARRAPAVPVTLSVIVTVIALIAFLYLLYRLVINPLSHEKLGAVLALLSAAAVVGGAWLSMRDEGVAPGDERREIPTVRLSEQ